MNTIKRGVIMAAGEGRRLRPITLTTPKPLIPVGGKRLIDTGIQALRANGITEIYVVVGYKKECYQGLPKEYPGLTLIENPYYDTCNNISSAYVAREHLSDAILMEADFLLQEPNMLRPSFERSGYCALGVDKPNPEEWMLTVDERGKITGCATDGSSGNYQLYGVSMWSAEDGKRLAAHLEETFVVQGRRDIYWDRLPLFLYAGEYDLGIREIAYGDIHEIDTLEELAAVDGSYETYLEQAQAK